MDERRRPPVAALTEEDDDDAAGPGSAATSKANSIGCSASPLVRAVVVIDPIVVVISSSSSQGVAARWKRTVCPTPPVLDEEAEAEKINYFNSLHTLPPHIQPSTVISLFHFCFRVSLTLSRSKRHPAYTQAKDMPVDTSSTKQSKQGNKLRQGKEPILSSRLRRIIGGSA